VDWNSGCCWILLGVAHLLLSYSSLVFEELQFEVVFVLNLEELSARPLMPLISYSSLSESLTTSVKSN
jgi:hypothetical protein